MPLETRVRTKDLIGNPHCKRCWGKGWTYITSNGVRDAVQCGCAKATKTITRSVPEPVSTIIPPHRAVKMAEGVNLRT